jgi:hypothetical protein
MEALGRLDFEYIYLRGSQVLVLRWPAWLRWCGGCPTSYPSANLFHFLRVLGCSREFRDEASTRYVHVSVQCAIQLTLHLFSAPTKCLDFQRCRQAKSSRPRRVLFTFPSSICPYLHCMSHYLQLLLISLVTKSSVLQASRSCVQYAPPYSYPNDSRIIMVGHDRI